MFGAIPKRAWSRKLSSDSQNRCLMGMNCVLVWTDDRLVLIDAGVGSKDLGKLSYYDFQHNRDIRELVSEAGFQPEDVTDVILTHLHFDHCGGCTYTDSQAKPMVAFPRAKHHVGTKQWDSYQHPNYLEADSFRPQDMMPVYEAGLLHQIDEPLELFPGLRIEVYDGHTRGQLAVVIEGEEEQVVVPGDVIPTQHHLSDAWISAYDIEPLLSLASKQALKATYPPSRCRYVFYHDSPQS